ncbi:polysaccharide biosynthesis tyrosine autokinase [Brasilonema sp. UFV-L1]|uniref:GumC family protein n=1 Tax=Brasilonema sp. UFV-L1 TaxID=2234130 RepID=UPI00145CC7D7|nr:polysaccharide biosynthesis tyrosine autokinase [Brasilonema sp. UFV-L1]NMG08824.1 lipopolysaccharide biosynthesis protein [Brasilonema sp. UFV-L1]
MESQETVVNIDKYWQALLQVLKRRWIPAIGIFFPVFLISVLAFSLKKPSYVAEGKLLFQRTTISSFTGVGTETAKLEPVAQDKSNPLTTEAEVILSFPVVHKTIETLNLKDNKGASLKPRDFIKQLTVIGIKETDILKVSNKNTNPEKAAQVVNTLMAVYLEHNISNHRAQAQAARKFIEKQVPKAELVVRQAEAELADFKEKNKVVALQEEANKAVEVIGELQKQISTDQSQIAEVKAQSEVIRNQLSMNSQQAIATTSLSQSPGVQDILKEIQQLESQLAARRTILQDRHPEIINLKSKLEALKGILQQRIGNVVGTQQQEPSSNLQVGVLQQQLTAELVKLESTRLGLVSKAAALSNLQAAYKQRLNILPKLEQQQRQLERKVQVSQSTYSLLLQKLQESEIAENQNLGNARIMSTAQVPEEPISSPMVSYLIASLIGILASLATIYLLEVRDKSIKTVDEAKELLRLTLLGVIPSFSKSKKSTRGNQESELSTHQLVVRDIPRSPISESFRMLRANLKYTSADQELKVIVITSSVPKEGKSTVAANLAIAMAQRERKVLLVDGDLHRPVQHQIWNLPNSPGLSNVIVGQAEIRAATAQVMDNLDVLTSGVVPPNPASLLDSKRMAGLIENFAANYDFVIIDAPSLTVAADAASIGQMADGVLLVVRPGVVNSVNAAFAKELLEKSGQNVLGQVVNGVIPKNEPHSYYYFTEEYNTQESDIVNKSTRTVR